MTGTQPVSPEELRRTQEEDDTPVAARMAGEVAGLLNKPYSFDQLRGVLKRVVEGVKP